MNSERDLPEITPELIERYKKEFPQSFDIAEGVIGDEQIAKAIAGFELGTKDDVYAALIGMMTEKALKMAAAQAIGEMIGHAMQEQVESPSDGLPPSKKKTNLA